MDNKQDQQIDENIKMLLKQNEIEVSYNIALETTIMKGIEIEADHSHAIARDRRLSQIGFWVCVGLVSILTVFILQESLYDRQLQEDVLSSKSLFSSLFALIGIFILYIQVEMQRLAK